MFLTILIFVSLVSAEPKTHSLCKGFLPPNNLSIPEGSEVEKGKPSGILKDQFDDILTRVYAEFAPEVQRQGGKLHIDRRWKDATVNSFADRKKDTWTIHMYGGLARYPTMTYDGFMAIACHELGHHLGGLPHFTGSDWTSVEGEADYYATLKCLRRIFAQDHNEEIVTSSRPDPIASRACSAAPDKWLCIRATMAGLGLSRLLSEMQEDPPPKLGSPDPLVVQKTFETHPHAQCRIDTFFQGATCPVSHTVPLDNQDYRKGTCTDTPGSRPRCWFAPPI